LYILIFTFLEKIQQDKRFRTEEAVFLVRGMYEKVQYKSLFVQS